MRALISDSHAQVTIAPRAVGLMATAFARLHEADESGCQHMVSLLLLQWLCKPWSSTDEVTQLCIAADITVLEQASIMDTSSLVRAAVLRRIVAIIRS